MANFAGTLRVAAVVVLAIAASCGSADPGTVTDAQPTVSTSATSGPPDCTTASTTVPVQTTELSQTSGLSPTTELLSTTELVTTESVTTVDPEVSGHQATLAGLGYWLGPVDGKFGSNTAHAVTAFQKIENLDRTGVLDAPTIERLAIATTPIAQSTSGSLLEVDLARQVLFAVIDGSVRWTFDVATGASSTPTPPGRFEIYKQIDGMRHAPLGTLYRPKYFNGGIALHGYTSVPAQPASHGCVRLTYPAIDFLWDADLAPIGSSVLVY